MKNKFVITNIFIDITNFLYTIRNLIVFVMNIFLEWIFV